ncbi:ATP-binding protein [Vibrio maerlii]|uniref:ATP-binding protein n=1 Tax=Vibrio maerlii TaxID=2231648 RepID=UPI000E3E421E|nr:ATP-binding protein [Vibrio maerlii]
MRRLYGTIRLNSLVTRTLLLTLFAVILAQGVATAIWYNQSKQKELQGIQSASESMAGMFASTTNFFQSLPTKYRHIVLNQIRDMGGTRFFVSFNREELIVEPVRETRLKEVSIEAVDRVLNTKLPNAKQILVDFTWPENLRLLKNDIYLADLPRSWAHHTLTLEPLNPPVLVVQIQIAEDEWIYIAALLPAPYVSLDDTILTNEQTVFLVFSTALLLILTFLMMKRQVRPLKRLASAANEMSMDIDQPQLKEEGATELVLATRAFNRMQQRIRRYISDREHLFSAISHDLKTPITRLRLRAELLDDDRKRDKFNRDLDDLEMMVKGALQCVRETDLHENNAFVDLNDLFQVIAEPFNSLSYSSKNAERPLVSIECTNIDPIICKPLAIKRVFTNLIENGVKYGGSAEVSVKDNGDWIVVFIRDTGPGIPEDKMDAVFEPYFRLADDSEGHGLGLGICRSILHAHGGDLLMSNIPTGGLLVEVYIPTDLDV